VFLHHGRACNIATQGLKNHRRIKSSLLVAIHPEMPHDSPQKGRGFCAVEDTKGRFE